MGGEFASHNNKTVETIKTLTDAFNGVGLDWSRCKVVPSSLHRWMWVTYDGDSLFLIPELWHVDHGIGYEEYAEMVEVALESL
jgi:hypothetical protein